MKKIGVVEGEGPTHDLPLQSQVRISRHRESYIVDMQELIVG